MTTAATAATRAAAATSSARLWVRFCGASGTGRTGAGLSGPPLQAVYSLSIVGRSARQARAMVSIGAKVCGTDCPAQYRCTADLLRFALRAICA
jgi:hypothetical protein